MSKLDPGSVRARGAIADVLRVKPWDVQIKTTKAGVYLAQLPKYTPSQHDEKLLAVAEVVIGRPGWYVDGNAEKLTIELVPAERPMFGPVYKFPVGRKFDLFDLPLGPILPAPGGKPSELSVRLDDNVGVLLQGLAGSGKSVLINGFIYGALAAGHEVAVIDVPHKKADFEWMKPYVRENGWGCDFLEQSLAVVNLVYEEGKRRGQLFEEHGAKKWQDLPAKIRAENPILTLVVDEMSGLLTKPPIPRALPKDDPMRIEAEEEAAACDKLTIMLTKLPAEMRATGIRVLYATQQAQSNLAVPPSIKLNIPNRILLGPNQSKQQRGHAFATPEKVPWVPEYLIQDEAASRGVGVSEFEGRAPAVFKGFYASDDTFVSNLDRLGVPKARRPEPTIAQIDAVMPRLGEVDDGPPSSRLSREGGFGETDGRDAPQPRLQGAAAAAHTLKVQADAHARQQASG